LVFHRFTYGFGFLLDISLVSVILVFSFVKHKPKLIHARGFQTAMVAYVFSRLFRVPFVFDIRGFWADERADGGFIPRGGLRYRIIRRIESHLYKTAASVVVLSESAQEYIQAHWDQPNVPVIPTCTDLRRFRLERKKQPSKSPTKTLLYLGTTAGRYRFSEAVFLFKELSQQGPWFFKILSQDSDEQVRSYLSGLSPDSFSIEACAPDEVPDAIAGAAGAVFFLEPCFSNKGVMPTKVAELLASGVPCLTNQGIGDLDKIFRSHGVGVVVPDLSEESLKQGAQELLALSSAADIQKRCRETSERYFSIEQGVEKFLSAYDAALGQKMTHLKKAA
jgi:glycosyltransferase involved in cell wall biosynthesis